MLRRLLACALTGLLLAAALVGLAALTTAPHLGAVASALPPGPTGGPSPDPTTEPEPTPEPTGPLPLPTGVGPSPTPDPEPTAEPTARPTTTVTRPPRTRDPEPERTSTTHGDSGSSGRSDGEPELPQGFGAVGLHPSASARPVAVTAGSDTDDPILRAVQTGIALALVLGIAGIGGLYLTRHQP